MLNQPDEFKMSLELDAVSSEAETLLATNTRLGLARRAVEEVYALAQEEVAEKPIVMIDNQPVYVTPEVAEIMPYITEIHELRRQSLRADDGENYGLAA